MIGADAHRLPHFLMCNFRNALVLFWLCAALAQVATTQSNSGASGKPVSSAPAASEKGTSLAKSGHCKEAIPLLKNEMETVTSKDLKREAGFAGVRCAMMLNSSDAAMFFIQLLNHEFPDDPDVLYVAVHTFSDLSTRASLELARTAPGSYQAHQLNGEALEVQGKWDEAAKEYQAVLQQNPRLPGIHYRLGRILVSKPGFGPESAGQAKREFEQELEIDPSNAGAEYVLGALARQNQEWGEAIAHFARATKLDAGFADAFLGLGAALISVKQFNEAIPPLETAVKLQPQNPDAHYNLATAYSRAGRKEDAAKQFAIHREMLAKSGGASGVQNNPSSATPQ
jgi:tetratricopeptide (TPR) repeat protein